jgi:hypothetical protein
MSPEISAPVVGGRLFMKEVSLEDTIPADGRNPILSGPYLIY